MLLSGDTIISFQICIFRCLISFAAFWSIVGECMADITMLSSGQHSQISGMHTLFNLFVLCNSQLIIVHANVFKSLHVKCTSKFNFM